MPYDLVLPPRWRLQRWKVKIRDRERLEPPHATILRGTEAWRFCLRTEEFLDDRPDPDEIPDELVDLIRAKLELLRTEWDRMYPENPVVSQESEDG